MKLLLHICCAPCSIIPLEYYKNENYEVSGYFYNPNIHPISEHTKRIQTLNDYSKQIGLNVIYDNEYLEDEWLKLSKDTIRCNFCYQIRLENVFKYACQFGYDAVSTSLLISPYQNHELIKETCEKLASLYNVKFIYKDFRPLFYEGQNKAREYGLYRQKYCGCIFSLFERDNLIKIKKEVVK
ncbi:MAG: epoxyqueuosine reductase QueH [Acholeplasmatales bacterium]|jgi:predicted adenine nucleotide alpha hydrolase (AANH) superfamily ATPase|nr:epoxyqueuosine reductase QueH [Acholeplasmatales bacterium]